MDSAGFRDAREALILLLLAFAASALMILLIGRNPWLAFRAIIETSLGSKRAVGETLESATPLIFAGLAFAVAFKARLLNLGVGSQVLIGALTAAWLGNAMSLPRPAHIAVMVAAGAAAGAGWAAIAGVLKAYRGVHEVISTIMLEFVALSLINYLVNGPLQDPREAGLPQTSQIPSSARLPRILPPSRLSAGILILVAVGIMVWWLLNRSRLGFEWRASGTGPRASAMAGISAKRSIVSAMATSGAIAGIAGAVMMSGLLYRYQANTPTSFVGLAVALLSRNRVAGVFSAGLLFGVLTQGERGMQRIADVPQDMLAVMQGFIVFFVAAPQILWAVRRWRTRRKPGPDVIGEPA